MSTDIGFVLSTLDNLTRTLFELRKRAKSKMGTKQRRCERCKKLRRNVSGHHSFKRGNHKLPADPGKGFPPNSSICNYCLNKEVMHQVKDWKEAEELAPGSSAAWDRDGRTNEFRLTWHTSKSGALMDHEVLNLPLLILIDPTCGTRKNCGCMVYWPQLECWLKRDVTPEAFVNQAATAEVSFNELEVKPRP